MRKQNTVGIILAGNQLGSDQEAVQETRWRKKKRQHGTTLGVMNRKECTQNRGFRVTAIKVSVDEMLERSTVHTVHA